MNWLEVAILGFLAGTAGAIAADWRFWRDLAVDVKRHGLANRLCDDPNCSTCSR